MIGWNSKNYCFRVGLLSFLSMVTSTQDMHDGALNSCLVQLSADLVPELTRLCQELQSSPENIEQLCLLKQELELSDNMVCLPLFLTSMCELQQLFSDSSFLPSTKSILYNLVSKATGSQFIKAIVTNALHVCGDACFGGDLIIDGDLIVEGTIIGGTGGAIGPVGPTGPEGAPGSDGASGPIGPQGNTGAMGPTGTPGATGQQGATSAISDSNYISAWDETEQGVGAINTFTDITLDHNGEVDGWVHGLGSSSFTCAQTGIYLIAYSALVTRTGASGGVDTMEIRVLQNGGEVSGVRVGGNNDQTFTRRPVEFGRNFLLFVTNGDVLRWQWRTTASNGILTAIFANGYTAPSFSVDIKRVA
jgi:hypothetical protein